METTYASINLYKDYVERDEKWAELAGQALETQRLAKYYTDEAKKLIEALKDASGDASCHSGDYLFERIVRKGSIDFMAIPELQNRDLEGFRKEDTYAWKLSKK